MDYLNTWWIAQAHSECILHDSVIPTGDKPSPRAETVHGIRPWSLYIYEWSITRCFHGQSANYDIGASTQNIPEDEDVWNKLTLTVKLFHDCKFAKLVFLNFRNLSTWSIFYKVNTFAKTFTVFGKRPHKLISLQKRDSSSILAQCWSTVCDAASTLN